MQLIYEFMYIFDCIKGYHYTSMYNINVVYFFNKIKYFLLVFNFRFIINLNNW